MFQVDFAVAADIVGGDIFVLDEDFKDSGAPSVSGDADIDGLVPDDGGLFFTLNDFGSVLLGSAIHV